MMLRHLVMAMLVRLFGEPEEINGKERCPTYLYRWHIAKSKALECAAYLHRFVGDDWALDLHDHPRRFVSIGLWGSYLEVLPGEQSKVYRAPWLRTFPAEHSHRLCIENGKECWTLVIALPKSRQWGFSTLRGWLPWNEYVYGSDVRLACETAEEDA